jgi:hypothetical protein
MRWRPRCRRGRSRVRLALGLCATGTLQRFVGAAELRLLEDREGINPFTKQKTVFRAPADSVRVTAERRIVGSMHWALDDSPALIVWATREPDARATMSAIALEIAEALKGDFIPGSERDWA